MENKRIARGIASGIATACVGAALAAVLLGAVGLRVGPSGSGEGPRAASKALSTAQAPSVQESSSVDQEGAHVGQTNNCRTAELDCWDCITDAECVAMEETQSYTDNKGLPTGVECDDFDGRGWACVNGYTGDEYSPIRGERGEDGTWRLRVDCDSDLVLCDDEGA